MKILNVTGCEIYNPSIVTSNGCYVVDSIGKNYIDFESGVWALPLGHNNLKVNHAMINQMSGISHTAYRYNHPIVEETADALLEIMNMKDGKCLFLSSGSEAVEFAVKVINKISERPYLLNLEHHYLSAYGTCGNTHTSSWISIDWKQYVNDNLSNYDEILRDIPFHQVAAFVFEAGNASGCVELPPKELIHAIVSKVKENNGWIVVDEVTVGMGRTGKWFGFEHYNIQPDIIACGKGLGNGYPISAVGVCKEICELLEKMDFIYGQSHQNDPLGCSVAKEVITIIKEMDLLRKTTRSGEYLINKLSELKSKHSCIKEVRGIGLLCAIEFTDLVDQRMLSSIHRKLFDAGFIVGLKLAKNVLRFYPPLIIENHMSDEMIESLDSILQNISL